MKLLGVIPARGGSKGLQNKNIRLLAGRPLIAWSIEEAKKVKSIDRLICSTDDEKIASIASSYGCEVPFIRPSELAGDLTPGSDVLLHALKFFEEKGEFYDVGAYLQCTTPFRTAKDIEDAIDVFITKGLDSLAGICPVEFPLEWTFHLSAGRTLVPCLNMEQHGKQMQRQRFETAYRPNGAIYLIHKEFLIKCKSFLNSSTHGFIMDRYNSIDIDDQFDLEIANILLLAKQRVNY